VNLLGLEFEPNYYHCGSLTSRRKKIARSWKRESAKRQIYNLSQQGESEFRTDAAMIDVMEKVYVSGEG
jgi:hypothetical protein